MGSGFQTEKRGTWNVELPWSAVGLVQSPGCLCHADEHAGDDSGLRKRCFRIRFRVPDGLLEAVVSPRVPLQKPVHRQTFLFLPRFQKLNCELPLYTAQIHDQTGGRNLLPLAFLGQVENSVPLSPRWSLSPNA